MFDALTHERPYKAAWPVEDALTEIGTQAGKQFDPEVVEAFLELSGRGALARVMPATRAVTHAPWGAASG